MLSEIFLMLGAGGAQGSGMGTLLMLIPLFGIMYFLMIRPQRKKQQEHEKLLSQVKAGDKVMLGCGLFGTVQKVMDNKVVVDCNGSRLEFLTQAIAEIIVDAPKAEEKDVKDAK